MNAEGLQRQRRQLLARLAWAATLPAVVAGCVTVHGPRTLTLSREDIERAIEADLGAVLEAVRGLDGRRPDVAFMPVAGRVELAWSLTLPSDAPTESFFGKSIGVTVVASGKPQLNAARNGIDLTDVLLDDVRLVGLPRLFGYGLDRLADRKGARLPDLPLLTFAPSQLRVADVAYGATAVAVTWRGLQVDIAPR